jgi:hypothetical protein
MGGYELIGYWVVDYFWPKKKDKEGTQDRDPPGSTGQ